jgi:exodeoxyribonuclease-3
MVKVLTYNVNGIRSALRKKLDGYLQSEAADIVCLQETKAQPGQIEQDLFRFMGYEAYWHSAEKKGYSGVGILSRETPRAVHRGCGVEAYDREGRVLRLDFDELSVISLYLPNGSRDQMRQAFKMEFCDFFRHYIGDLLRHQPRVVVCGDFNICHQPIDIHDPVRNAKTSGFLPEERAWLSTFLETGMTDAFRELYPDKVQYSWWSFRAGARQKNKGWRIDYTMVSHTLASSVRDAWYQPQAVHSDHCPGLVALG